MNGCLTAGRLTPAELDQLPDRERAAVLATREAFRGVAELAADYRAAGYASVGRMVARVRTV